MIDELVLEQLLDDLAQGIDVPPDGAERVVHQASTDVPRVRRPSPRSARLLLVAAVLVVIGGLALLMHGNASGPAASTASKPAAANTQVLAPAAKSKSSSRGGGAASAPGLPVQGSVHSPDDAARSSLVGEPSVGANGTVTAGSTPVTAPTQSPTAPIEGALVVKTGSLDLQVPHGGLRPTVNAVTTTVAGLGGYVVNQNTSYSGTDPTGTITVRVPVNLFEKAISEINGLPGVKVLRDNETGKDVTAQYVNVQAQITADTTEEHSILALLARAQDLNDILTLRSQATAVETTIDELQGQNNLLRNEAAYSDLAITATEALAKGQKPPSHHSATGLSKAWSDASSGFARSVEWFIARSGAALILFLVALLFVFGLRYLYPVLRRALL